MSSLSLEDPTKTTEQTEEQKIIEFKRQIGEILEMVERLQKELLMF